MTKKPSDVNEVQSTPELAPELAVEVRDADPLRVLPTPLHMKTSLACQTNEWTAWAGYTVPMVCSTLEREMAALTRGATLCDVSPLGKYLVTGIDAVRFLNHLLFINVAALEKGEAVLSPMCASSGKVVNIVTLAQVGAEDWWLICDGHHMNWLEQSASGFDVDIKDRSQTHAGIVLAGPSISSVLMDADLGDCTDIVLRGARHIVWDNIETTLIHQPDGSVPGLTILCPARDAAIVWNRLMDGGQDHRLEVVGQLARTSLRIDSGIPATGHDFVSAPGALRSDRSRSALELGFGALIDEKKGVFNGRAALLEERSKGSRLRLATFSFQGSEPRQGAHLHKKEGRKDVIVGMVTSVSSSPHVTGARGLGFVVAGKVHPGDVLEVVAEETKELLQASRRQPAGVLSVAD